MHELIELEQKFTDAFYAMDDRTKDKYADEFFFLVNHLRQIRFNVTCWNCDDCGLAFPPDDLSWVKKAGGQAYYVCTSCVEFGELVRALFGKAA